jgi:hypothetical protein
MYKEQFPGDVSLSTPTQQSQWFELVAREETIRLLNDSLRAFCVLEQCTEIKLPLRKLPTHWNEALARLPERLANDGNRSKHCSDEFVLEYALRDFLEEATAELFPGPEKSAPAKRSVSLSHKDQELYRALGHENIATHTNQQLWKTDKFRLGLRRAGYEAFRAQLYRIRTVCTLPSSQSISKAKKKSVQP